jgi:hypothetical protein
MSFLSGLGSGATFLTPKFLWLSGALLVVIVAIYFARVVAAGRTRPPKEPVRQVAMSCRVNGHAYGEHDTGWRCATCGNFVPRRDGELYGLVSDGRHERRRHSR